MSMPPQANLIFLLITLKSAIIDTKINSYSIEGNRLEITMHKNSKTIFVHGLKCKFDFSSLHYPGLLKLLFKSFMPIQALSKATKKVPITIT